MVKYIYDAWGNHTVRTNDGTEIAEATHIGNINPIRYRGYYYDTEIGLYYLQTRYYDPTTGRFVTIDGIAYADPESINGLNLYAYCGNNPVMNVDPTGHFFWFILAAAVIAGVLIGGVSGGISAAQNGQSIWKGVLLGALKGAVTGAAFGLGGALGTAAFVAGTAVSAATAFVALGGTVIGSFAAGIGIYALKTHLYGEEFRWGEAFLSGGFLAIESALNFGMGLVLGAKGYWPQNKQIYSGFFKKLIGNIKFIIANKNIIIERMYLKFILFPITYIMNCIKDYLCEN